MRYLSLLFILAAMVHVAACSHNSDDSKNEKLDRIYLPYTQTIVNRSEVLVIARTAIEKSFENVAQGVKDPDFPDSPGPMNLEFPKTRTHDYCKIIGYEQQENNPRMVTFLIGSQNAKGLHMAVVIDIKNKKALKVYNRPGS